MSPQSEPRFRIGVIGRGVARAAHYRGIDVVEIDLPDPVPRPATARRWRTDAPAQVAFTARLVVPTGATPAMIPALPALQTARALEPSVLVVCTPPSLTPGSDASRLLGALRAAWGDGALAWEPAGVWEDREIAALCSAHRISHATDPTQRQPATDTPVPYLRLRGLGMSGHRYADRGLETIAEALLRLCAAQAGGLIHCVFGSTQAPDDAARLRRLLAELEAGEEEDATATEPSEEPGP